MATEIRLSEGTTIRINDDNVQPDDVINLLKRHEEDRFVGFSSDDGYTYRVNPVQVVWLRQVA